MTPKPRRAAKAKPPTCSVVIAAHNADATIAQSLASVLGQTRRDLEVLVVDDGSTDKTQAVVSEYAADPRVHVHRHRNGGPAKARNIGIGLARGRYVSFLDSDDVWLPRYLELMVGALECAPRAAFAYTRTWIIERTSNRIRRDPWPAELPSFPQDDSRALLGALIERNFFCISVTVRRDILHQVGGFDPNVSHAEDYELWLRIAAAGHGARQVSGPLLVCSDRPSSLSKDNLAMYTGKKVAYERLLTAKTLSTEIRMLVERRLEQTNRMVALHAGERRRTSAEVIRRVGARATRPLRHRSQFLSSPPPEVAAWFPGMGEGTRDGVGPEWVPVRRNRLTAGEDQ